MVSCMTYKPTISVIIPCYKQAHFLIEAVASVRAQTLNDWEVIIVDDGSPDDTAIVAATLAENDSRIRLFRKINGGLSSARNVGLKLARGDYIQFLDADDFLYPEKFKVHIDNLIFGTGDEITYTDYYHGAADDLRNAVNGFRIDNTLKMTFALADFSSRWEHDFSIPIHAALFPSKIIKTHNISFDEELNNHEDWDFWMKIVSVSSKVIYIPKVLAIYRCSDLSMSRDRSAMWLGFRKAIKKQMNMNSENLDIKFYLFWLSYRNDYLYDKGFAKYMKKITHLRGFNRLPRCAHRLLTGRTKWLGFSN